MFSSGLNSENPIDTSKMPQNEEVCPEVVVVSMFVTDQLLKS